MAPTHPTIGTVLFANEETLLLTDRTLFVAPAGMHLPYFPAGSSVVVQYEILDGRNVRPVGSGLERLGMAAS
jgi:hypothetical protein